MNGLHEDAQEFRHPVALDGPGRFRSIAGVGPMYEIIGRNALTVRIRFVHTDEEHDYPLADAELDPIA
jgi:hypothetical protein